VRKDGCRPFVPIAVLRSRVLTKTTTRTETYDNPWTFDGVVFTEEDIGEFEGFCYLITNKLNNRRYIGRKYFYERRKPKGKTRRTKKLSNWQDYYGSSELLAEDISVIGNKHFDRQILSLHVTRGDANMYEVMLQFEFDVLTSDDYYNQTIGKYRRKPDHIAERRKIACITKMLKESST
jgi:hypothetical protein